MMVSPFQASPQVLAIFALHDTICFQLVWVTVVVVWFLGQSLTTMATVTRFVTHHRLEFLWTLMPAGVLALIAVPSLTLLQLFDQEQAPALTIKVVGNQWQWRQEANEVAQDSQLNQEALPRLLKTDQCLILPTLTPLRLVVTASDVIHSFAVPNLGIKVDAVPGRLNALHFQILSEGLHQGQCSELCGALHGFMPIEVLAVSPESWAKLF